MLLKQNKKPRNLKFESQTQSTENGLEGQCRKDAGSFWVQVWCHGPRLQGVDSFAGRHALAEHSWPMCQKSTTRLRRAPPDLGRFCDAMKSGLSSRSQGTRRASGPAGPLSGKTTQGNILWEWSRLHRPMDIFSPRGTEYRNTTSLTFQATCRLYSAQVQHYGPRLCPCSNDLLPRHRAGCSQIIKNRNVKNVKNVPGKQGDNDNVNGFHMSRLADSALGVPPRRVASVPQLQRPPPPPPPPTTSHRPTTRWLPPTAPMRTKRA